jgi:hypothetical protein
VKQADPQLAQDVKNGKVSVDSAEAQVRTGRKTEPRSTGRKTSKAAAPKPKRLSRREREAATGRMVDTVLKFTAELERMNPDLELDTANNDDMVALVSARDALIDLDIWKDQLLLSIQRYIGDTGLIEKIRSLESEAGRSPAEIELAKAAAQKYRRRLARLTAPA